MSGFGDGIGEVELMGVCDEDGSEEERKWIVNGRVRVEGS